MDEERKEKHILIAVFATVCAAWALTGTAVYFALGDWAVRGQFGDMFGAVNALFSGLAFAGLVVTIFLQRNELALQRNELELTRQELSRSAQAQEDASRALTAQIEMQILSSRLNALNTLLASVNAKIGSMQADNRTWVGTGRSWSMSAIETHRQELETEIEHLLGTLKQRNKPSIDEPIA